MFRRDMAANEGMLFDFGAEERRSFWMRNTYIPLDMIFIKADGTIDSIAERATPLSEKSVPSKGAGPLRAGDQRGLERQPRHRAGRQGLRTGDRGTAVAY